MLNFRPHIAVLCLCTSLLLQAGCESAKHPQTFGVQGEFFVKGQPADGALLILQPESPSDLKLWPLGFPTAKVQPDGTFQFSCFAENDGAPEGAYKLLARWDEGNGERNEHSNLPPPKNRLDARYFDPAHSPWSVKVEPRPNQLTRFEVP